MHMYMAYTCPIMYMYMSLLLVLYMYMALGLIAQQLAALISTWAVSWCQATSHSKPVCAENEYHWALSVASYSVHAIGRTAMPQCSYVYFLQHHAHTFTYAFQKKVLHPPKLDPSTVWVFPIFSPPALQTTAIQSTCLQSAAKTELREAGVTIMTPLLLSSSFPSPFPTLFRPHPHPKMGCWFNSPLFVCR